jgi:hypothetical protein
MILPQEVSRLNKCGRSTYYAEAIDGRGDCSLPVDGAGEELDSGGAPARFFQPPDPC